MQDIGFAACNCTCCHQELFSDRSNSIHKYPGVHSSNGCRKNNKRMNRTLENIQLTGLEAIMLKLWKNQQEGSWALDCSPESLSGEEIPFSNT